MSTNPEEDLVEGGNVQDSVLMSIQMYECIVIVKRKTLHAEEHHVDTEAVRSQNK